MHYLMDTYKAQPDGLLKRKICVLETMTIFQQNKILVIDSIAGSQKGYISSDRPRLR